MLVLSYPPLRILWSINIASNSSKQNKLPTNIHKVTFLVSDATLSQKANVMTANSAELGQETVKNVVNR